MSLLTTMPESWQSTLDQEFNKPYFKELISFLDQQQKSGISIYPAKNLWFHAFTQTPLSQIKCVIVGQDPYFSNPHQAHGLSFSVPDTVKPPPSLKNIFKELESDLKLPLPESGNLQRWATEEGIFLLNASLTVEAGKAGSHLNRGWLTFTQSIIKAIDSCCEHVVFLSWGAFSHKICNDINLNKHKVIKTTHPSPLGARKNSKQAPAFLGSKCFSQANQWLITQGIAPINWQL